MRKIIIRFMLAIFMLLSTSNFSYADDDSTLQNLKARADQGDAQALTDLGFRYSSSSPLLNETEAARLFSKAAAKGNADAQTALGFFYATGHGLPKNESEAKKWFEKAALQGNWLAQGWLGSPSINGKLDDEDYVADAKQKAREALIRLRDSEIQTFSDTYTVFNDKQNLLIYQQGADINPSSQFNLGLMYEYGNGIIQDHAQAVKWFKKAAESGDAAGQLLIAHMYETGNDIPQDYTTAIYWAKKAAKQGLYGAQLNLGMLYYKKAKDASSQDLPLGLSCRLFKYTDLQEAYAWLSVAAVNEDINHAAAIRDEVASLLKPDALTQAQKLAKLYFDRYSPQNTP